MSLSRRSFVSGLFAAVTLTAGTDEAMALGKGRGNSKKSIAPEDQTAIAASPSAEPPRTSAPPINYVFVGEDGIVFRQNFSSVRRHPASLTKMMTLYTVMQVMEYSAGAFDCKTPVKIPDMAAKIRRDIYRFKELKPGQHYTAESLAIACGSCSCAASTLALAVHAGGLLLSGAGTEEERHDAFVGQMNRNAATFRMRDTFFTNPVGAPDPRHYSTAIDMTLLMKALHTHYPENSRKFMGHAYFALPGIRSGGHHTSRFLINHREETVFAKTGTTNAAGRCLAATFNVKGKTCYGVIIGAGRDYDRNVLMQAGLDDAIHGRRQRPPRSISDYDPRVFGVTA